MGVSIRVALVVWAGALLLRLPHGRSIMKSVEGIGGGNADEALWFLVIRAHGARRSTRG